MPTLAQKQQHFAVMLARLILFADAEGWAITIGEVERTKEQQALYVQQGQSQTMASKHLKKLAADLNLFKDGKYCQKVSDYAALGAWWKGQDPQNVWGGDWARLRDARHFEYAG